MTETHLPVVKKEEYKIQLDLLSSRGTHGIELHVYPFMVGDTEYYRSLGHHIDGSLADGRDDSLHFQR